jgi:hypothetical protein
MSNPGKYGSVENGFSTVAEGPDKIETVGRPSTVAVKTETKPEPENFNLSTGPCQWMFEVKIFMHEIEALLREFENSFKYNYNVVYFETIVGASHECLLDMKRFSSVYNTLSFCEFSIYISY